MKVLSVRQKTPNLFIGVHGHSNAGNQEIPRPKFRQHIGNTATCLTLPIQQRAEVFIEAVWLIFCKGVALSFLVLERFKRCKLQRLLMLELQKLQITAFADRGTLQNV